MKIHATLLSEQPRMLELDGRLGWAMCQLAQAGAHGIETVKRPAPRWSAYVHELRSMGIPIETEMVAHGGPYPGRHARYRLACDASITILRGEAA
tara:strand:- start:344 stop:628 length:285 start_codon:yes stop_codon:yes gene_type:complete